jgi:biopolymer transport protein ExbB
MVLERFICEAILDVRTFMKMGGPTLWLILLVAVVLFALIIERFWFIKITCPCLMSAWMEEWNRREDKSSWFARQIRQAMISHANILLYRPIPFIRTLTAISPLLGLLGTVIGMIEVFDVVAGAGTGNPRAVASGVSQAMITTMAGMVVALAGLFFGTWVRQYVKIETERLSNALRED